MAFSFLTCDRDQELLLPPSRHAVTAATAGGATERISVGDRGLGTFLPTKAASTVFADIRPRDGRGH